MKIKICFDNGIERMAENIDEIDEENFKVIFNDGKGNTETIDLTRIGTEFLRRIDVAQMFYLSDTWEQQHSEEDENS